LILQIAEPKATEQMLTPSDVYKMTRKYATRKQESMFVLTLNGKHAVIRIIEVTRGLVNKTLCHPREILRPALEDNAISIMMVHNHPSGNSEPSNDDNEITERMKQASDLMGITLLDHLVITTNGYYSYLEAGRL